MLQELKRNISSVFIGKEHVVDLLLVSLLADGHVLLEDVPGTGKTLLAKTLAKSIGGQFSRIQFTPDVLPGDVTGMEYFNPKLGDFTMRLGPVVANVLLADEINRAMPRTQSSLLEAMEERQVTIEGRTTPLPRPFFVIATQNPIESQGTFPLPDAQLDRFLMTVPIGYPNAQEELEIIRRFRQHQPFEALEAVIDTSVICTLQEQVKTVHMTPVVEEYLIRLAQATRQHEYIEVGISPRGTLALMRAAQAFAFLQGRTYCTPQDMQTMLPYVWSHRLVLSMEGTLRVTKQEALNNIVTSVDVPVEIEGR
ncbi:MoxR family ATPase [Ectobacillus antri]|jgi:MoxR-like ATPase|uniref:MoxR family ATPase n=1 Tax=Ectobacillus antri TaxID=2486280 RepID=A0ABT6H5Q4_9BACI|nr:MoxR family ATPase [Ectobacillus antri]MDG4657258.1 MoxR family ATPase [Ectobacillus antri]MDG5754390.1 MoxR family ATPase [Ectobacillus antri]